MKRASTLRRVAVVFAGQVGRVGMGALSALVIAAFIGPSAKGLLATIVGLSTISSVLLSLGMNGAATYFVGSERWSIRQASGVLLAATAWTCLLAALAWSVMAGIPFIASLVGQGISVLIFTTATAAQTLSSVLGGVLLGRQEFKVYSVQAAFAPLVTLCAFFVLLAGGSEATAAAIGSWVLGLAISCLPGLYILARQSNFRLGWPDRFGDAISYGLKSSLATAMSVLNLRLDVVLLAALGGAVATGQYALGVQFTELLWIVPTAVGYVVLPEVAAAVNYDGNRTAKLCRIAMLLGLIVGIAGLVSAAVYVWLVPEYRPSLSAILILLPGTIAFTAAKVVGNDLYGRGMPQAHVWAAGISVLFTLAGDVVLIPIFGFKAAAAVSSVSYALYAAIILWWFRDATGIRPAAAVVPTAEDIRGLISGVRSWLYARTASRQDVAEKTASSGQTP